MCHKFRAVRCRKTVGVTTRRQFVKNTALSFVSAPLVANPVCTAATLFDSHRKRPIMIPQLTLRWQDAEAIGPPSRRLSQAEIDAIPVSMTGFSTLNESLAIWRKLGPLKEPTYADFCEIKDRSGRWHLFGIEIVPNLLGNNLYHYVSDHLTGRYVRLPSITGGLSAERRADRVTRMCSPCIVWKDRQTAFMFYGHVIDKISADGSEEIYDASIRILESTDPKLEKWVPKEGPGFLEKNILFREKYCRDPEVIWDDKRQLYFMYYAVGDGWTDPEVRCVIRVRSSRDLIKWSEPKTLLAPPPGYRAAESPCILKRDDLYYLWVSGVDWGRMSLYVSEDPLNFGDPVRNRIMEQS